MLRFVDSFDHYATADGNLKGYSYSAGAVTASIGRNSTAGLRVSNTNFYGELTLPGAAINPIITGFGYRAQNPSGSTLLTLQNGPLASSGVTHLHFDLDGSGFIRVRRGISGTVLATGTHAFTSSVYRFVEIEATIHDSTGAVLVHVDEEEDINISGQDTLASGTAAISVVRLGFSGTGFGTNQDFDDLYVCDDTGGVNDAFLGDVRVEAIFPNANGNTSNLVGSDSNSTDNYLLVDETSPNGDTDYVESSTVSDKDTYNYGSVTPTSGTIAGLQILAYARKTDAGTRSIATVARHSGTEVDSSDFTLSTSYNYLMDIRETKPGGGTWSISNVNAAEFGVKVTA